MGRGDTQPIITGISKCYFIRIYFLARGGPFACYGFACCIFMSLFGCVDGFRVATAGICLLD